MRMSNAQYEFGEKLLSELCEKFKLHEEDMLRVITRVYEINNFYSWVNASEFLEIKQYGELTEALK